MSLAKYREKRTFSQTPEPEGGKASGGELRFVIQKHAASRLHYDFRLEMEGVLKSWAVPKGPTTDPSIKRLAMMVEDHPYDYRNFEGVIPDGNYGAGTVIVWDEGTYEPLEPAKDRKEQEKLLLKELYAGSLKFVLHGKKLKGEFALVRTRGQGENSWLLIKHRDKYAAETDITLKDKSVLSRKTLEQMAKKPVATYGKTIVQPGSTKKDDATSKKKINIKDAAPAKSSKKAAPVKKAAKKAAASKTAVKKKARPHPGLSKLLDNAPQAKFPKTLQPMLATLVNKPFDDADWLYEIKWDGYRTLALMNKGQATMLSRNGKSFDEKFYPIHQAITGWGINAVVDGEIVVVNEKGVSDFGALQGWRSEADGNLLYYVFDIVWLDGKNLMELPLTERKEILQSLISGTDDCIRLSEGVAATGTHFFEAAKKMGLEGIIAKKAGSTYLPGLRTQEWLKIKTGKRQEVVIGGYTRNENTSKPFSSLLVGVYEKGKLQYTGKIGTGFSQQLQKQLLQQFKPLEIKQCPFVTVPDINKPSRFRPNPPQATATWLKPRLICEVSFAEMTSDGVMRHPSFEGMREDKQPETVHTETPVPAEKLVTTRKSKLETTLVKTAPKQDRKTLLNPKDETQVRSIGGHELKFTNLSKIYWPSEKYTKRDLLNYYYQAAPFILPYLKNRPQSLNRFPNGINGESFYQKNVTGKVPDWIETFPYHSNADGQDRNFMVCTDEAGLMYMASLGCIEMNPWNSRVEAPDYPDWCILDLDPDTTNTFEQVIRTAQVIKQILDDINVPAYCKTSGSTGIHIYIPLKAQYTYDECQLFGKWVAQQAHAQLPGFTSIERMTKNRKGKLYIDYLQNRPQATLAAPYAVRPKPGATVSMPLFWEEVKKGLSIKNFTIKNAIARMRNNGDIFKPVLGKGINMGRVLKLMNREP